MNVAEPRPLSQPERTESRLGDPASASLSKRDYVGIVMRAARQASRDHVTSVAAALAYYAFLAIPSGYWARRSMPRQSDVVSSAREGARSRSSGRLPTPSTAADRVKSRSVVAAYRRL
jgi:hypothetical protein